MSRITLRTSTIFIASGEHTKVYRNLKDVPPKLRRRLVECTSGSNSATILIADRSGRQELARAVRGLPNALRCDEAPTRKRSRCAVRHAEGSLA